MNGWIRLHREIKEHWIWQNPRKYQWWTDLLMMANYSDGKIVNGGELIELKAGDIICSLGSLSRSWMVTKKTVMRFLQDLESADQIRTKNVPKGKLISICNYAYYQGSVNDEYYEKETPSITKVNKIRKKNTKSVINNTLSAWRDSFDVYQEECRIGFTECYTDETYIKKLANLYPGLDIRKSMQMAYDTFWHTEDGWHHKKKSKSSKLDWPATIQKTIQFNQVRL